MDDVKEENPAIPELWFVKCFVNGLREGLKYHIRPLKPPTLTDAICIAKELEPCYPPISKRAVVPYHNY